jgi:Lrp/AsnC family leucine-responsive transcriptional regulator
LPELDQIDLHILRILQERARITNQELADQVGLSPSPCLRRLRLLEQTRVIQRYVALLDPSALGLGVAVFVEVKLSVKNADAATKFEAAIAEFKEVLECHIVAGDYDYLLRIVAADIPSVRQFIMTDLLAIPGVGETRSSFSLGEVKYSTALPI